jgi:hypothetical protein
MWIGVLRGLAGMKLSGSPRLYGKIKAIVINGIMTSMSPRISFLEKKGWNRILSNSFNPVGLFDPVTCKEAKWMMIIPIKMKGNK